MNSVKTYTYLDKKEKVFGLEIADFLILAIAYAITFMVSTSLLVNIPLLIGVYLALRIYKHGKPPKYTAMMIRFVATPKFYTVPGRENT